MEVSQKVLKLCNLIEDKKGEDIVVCNLAKLGVNSVDYYIITSVNSTTHTKSLADYLEEAGKNESSFNFVCREGFNLSEWIVLDFDDVFVHIFTKNKRDYYNLEKLVNEGNNVKDFEKIKKQIAKSEKKITKKETTAVVKAKKAISKAIKKVEKK